MMFFSDNEVVNSLIENIYEREDSFAYESGWVDVGEIFTGDDINMLTETNSELEEDSSLEDYM